VEVTRLERVQECDRCRRERWRISAFDFCFRIRAPKSERVADARIERVHTKRLGDLARHVRAVEMTAGGQQLRDAKADGVELRRIDRSDRERGIDRANDRRRPRISFII
jgi:hypothetical protein